MAGPRKITDSRNMEGSGYGFHDPVIVQYENATLAGLVESVHQNAKKIDVRIVQNGEFNGRIVTLDPADVSFSGHMDADPDAPEVSASAVSDAKASLAALWEKVETLTGVPGALVTLNSEMHARIDGLEKRVALLEANEAADLVCRQTMRDRVAQLELREYAASNPDEKIVAPVPEPTPAPVERVEPVVFISDSKAIVPDPAPENYRGVTKFNSHT